MSTDDVTSSYFQVLEAYQKLFDDVIKKLNFSSLLEKFCIDKRHYWLVNNVDNNTKVFEDQHCLCGKSQYKGKIDEK